MSSVDGLDTQAKAATATKKGATVTQDAAVIEGAELLNKAKQAVRTGARANKAMWKALGIGAKVEPLVGPVTKGIGVFLKGAVTHAAELRQAGILDSDLARLQALQGSISQKDTKQEEQKVSAKDANLKAKTAMRRLEDNLVHLCSIAKLALSTERAALYHAALPVSAGGKGGGGGTPPPAK